MDQITPNRFFQILPLGDTSNRLLPIFKDAPKGLELYDHYLRQGIPVKQHYPINAKLQMNKRSRSDELTAFLSNTMSFLLVHEDVKNVIQQTLTNEIEYLPISILDKEGKLLSESYWILNPIGACDLVDREASTVDYDENEILGVRKLVFNKEKSIHAPHLFRVSEAKQFFFISKELAQVLYPYHFSNLFVDVIEVK
jgi:hypothetical protein